MSSGPRHSVARPAQYTCRGSATSTWRSARVYMSTASEATGSPAAARARAKPATPTSGSVVTDIRVSPGQQSVQPRPGDTLQVLVILDDRAKRGRRGLCVEDIAVEFTQRPRPIQRFGDAGRLDQFHATQRVHSACHLVCERLCDAGNAAAKNRDFTLQVGMLEPVVEAAPL